MVKCVRGGAKYLESCSVFKCTDCGYIWHKECSMKEEYYETAQYREEVDGSAEIDKFFEKFDALTLMKLEWLGTERFRNKVVMDVGCAGGIFLDYIKGIANYTIAVEPSNIFQLFLKQRHQAVYSYASEVALERKGQIDIACSFDVIEHVEDVVQFLMDIYSCLKRGGEIVVGTPTLAVAYEETLGDVWRAFNFRTQHPNVFTAKSLRYLLQKIGFSHIEIKSVQRYDLGNLLSWCLFKEPKGNKDFSWISETLNSVFKKELEVQGLGDYLVAFAYK